MSQTVLNHDVKTIEGAETRLSTWQGNVLLIVNVASQCGLTPQYEQLEALQKTYGPRGFTVLGFPCNQFLGQEPLDEAAIQTFCSTTYGVTFPMFSKIEVNGEHRHPLYQQLTSTLPQAIAPEGSGFLERMSSKGRAPKIPGDILWNFEKFLISREGTPVQRFSPDMTPDNPVLVRAIEQALA